MDNVVSVRLDEKQMEMLQKLCESTGWTYSQVFRHMLDNASIRPATIRVDLPSKHKEEEHA